MAEPQASKVVTASTEDEYVKMRAALSRRDEWIEIDYIMESKTSMALLVFDALQRVASDGLLKYDPNLAYVTFAEPDVLYVKRVVPPPPVLKNVEFSYIPWAHRLADAVQLKGRIRLAVPVAEFNSYYPASEKTTYRKAEARRVRLVLMYVPLVGRLAAAPVGNGTEFFRLDGSKADFKEVQRRTVELEFLLDGPIPVKRRADLFERV